MSGVLCDARTPGCHVKSLVYRTKEVIAAAANERVTRALTKERIQNLPLPHKSQLFSVFLNLLCRDPQIARKELLRRFDLSKGYVGQDLSIRHGAGRLPRRLEASEARRDHQAAVLEDWSLRL